MHVLERKLPLALPLCWMAGFWLAACSFSFEVPSSASVNPDEITKEPIVSTFAGNPPCNDDPDYAYTGQHRGGYLDGPGNVAQFNKPTDIAFDTAGNLFVLDSGNLRIRKITPEGVVSTVAGDGTSGTTNGDGTKARFDTPRRIAIDRANNLYVSDKHSIRKITPEGMVSTFAGSFSNYSDDGFRDGMGTEARFYSPHGIAAAADGTLYVADTSNHRIRKISPEREVTSFAGGGGSHLSNDVGDAAGFWNPQGIAIGTDGNIYVADTGNNRIRKITLDRVVSTFAGSKYERVDGIGAGAGLQNPFLITMGANGNFYVLESNVYNNYSIRKVTMQAEVTTLASGPWESSGKTCADAPYRDGPLSQAKFNYPGGLAVAPNGELYVADTFNHRIRKITWE